MSKETRSIDPDILSYARENRRRQSPAEAKLWNLLRNRRLDGLKFRRQHPIGRFIVDFYCHEARLIVELDGRSHDAQLDYDALRTGWLQEQGYRVVRFTNEQVLRDAIGVAEVIRVACREEPSP
jgi:very-short-patch-repair endonuclease